ncbi:MAG: hypothetical protein WCO51_00705 [bacterium]
MPYPIFDRKRLQLRPLDERIHDVHVCDLFELTDTTPVFEHPNLDTLSDRMAQAVQNKRPVILMMGAHVIKVGLSRFVIDMMKRGMVTHVAMNGAGPIHDSDLALVGGTSESVKRYIKKGEFGLWEEAGRLNEAAKEAALDGIGYGEAIGRMISSGGYPHEEISILAAGYKLKVPVTVHVGIGYDIIHQHPNCDGAAIGTASYTDFLVYAHAVSQLEGGVLLCFGSAVMGPEVYLKALSMARNVAIQEGREIRHFATGVFDLMKLEGDLTQEAPTDDPRYYYRPWKTILVRTVQDGGESFYFAGDHRATMPSLYRKVIARL